MATFPWRMPVSAGAPQASNKTGMTTTTNSSRCFILLFLGKNSLDDLATILRNLQELDKELYINPTQEMLDLYWNNIKIAVGDADLEYWELFYAEGEWWVEHGHPDI